MTITNGVELMEYNENYEIYKFIELEADNFTSMEDILKEYKLTFEHHMRTLAVIVVIFSVC